IIGAELRLLGMFTTNVSYGDTITRGHVYVTEKKLDVLGRELIGPLRIFQMEKEDGNRCEEDNGLETIHPKNWSGILTPPSQRQEQSSGSQGSAAVVRDDPIDQGNVEKRQL